MSGPPAFQTNAFQQDAFQSGVQLVAADYSLGSPSFATPALTQKYVFSQATYDLQRPIFALPPLSSFSGITALHANPYFLGSPSFATPTVRAVHRFLAQTAYALGSPAFAAPAIAQLHRIASNAAALGSPDFATPRLTEIHQLVGASSSVGALDWGAVGPIISANHVLHANAYWLDHPRFGFPRMQWQVVTQPWPLTYKAAVDDAATMLRDLLNILLSAVPPSDTPERNTVRRLIAVLRNNAEAAIRGTTLGTDLAEIYLALDAARATFGGIDNARQFLMTQVASKSVYSQMIFRSALIMTLGLESTIISRITFETQEQVQNMIVYMRDAFDAARAIGIDEVDVNTYRSLTTMSGALIDHLSKTQLQLPRMVVYRTAIPMPSLYLANRIYADTTRADEIEKQNGVIHPAFMPMTLKVRSNARYPNS